MTSVEEANSYRNEGIHQTRSWVTCDRTGYTGIPVLEFLEGKPWDDIALNYIEGLRPSCIRVICLTKNGVSVTHDDANLWRVSVFLEHDKLTISNIVQEITVGLRGGLAYGAALTLHHDRKKKDPILV